MGKSDSTSPVAGVNSDSRLHTQGLRSTKKDLHSATSVKVISSLKLTNILEKKFYEYVRKERSTYHGLR